MRRILSITPLLMLFLISAVLILGFVLKKEDADDGDTLPAGSSYFEGMRIINRENGIMLWSFMAKQALLVEGGKTAHLKGVRVSFPDRGVEVEAKQGVYDMESKDLALLDSIRATTKDYVITTESITLYAGKELSTDDKVVLEGKRLKIEGHGLRANDNVLLKDVTAVFF